MSKPYRYPHQHLLSTKQLSRADIEGILSLAVKYISLNREKEKKNPILKGRTLINVFFENSTRTRTSFELAGKRLGADVINMQVAHSAISKGETLLDTAATLNAMHPDFVTVRHPESGAVHLLSQKMEGAVINAGDGFHEHPTQALLDALAICYRLNNRKIKKLSLHSLKGKTIAICGDIFHSRVARSNLYLLRTMGANVRLIAPKTLMPPAAETLGAEIFYDMAQGIRNADVIMMLRIQRERMTGGSYFPSEREYFHFYGLDYAKLKYAKDDVLVMHPGPINRGLEIDSELADDIQRSIILDQVEMGVAVRQAILEAMA